MNVSLTPQLESLVRQKVESGLYNNASEVVREALRLLEERDREKLARLRAAVAVGRDEIARGEIVEWTPDFMDRLKAEAAEEDRQGLPISDDVQP
jgi:antitoxin ParD1/3/4